MPRQNHRARLEELKALRKSGKKAFDSYQPDEIDDLYDEVDEDGYKKIVRERLNKDDFVVDDNGEATPTTVAKTGTVFKDTSPTAKRRSTGEDVPARRKAREDEQSKRDANDRDISAYFKAGAQAQAKPKVVKTQDDDDFMAGLLGEVDTNIPTPARLPKHERSGERRKARVLSPAPEPASKKRKSINPRLPSPPAPNEDQDDEPLAPMPMDDDEPLEPAVVPTSDPAPSSPAAKVAERKAVKQEPKDEDEEDEDMMEVAHAGTVNTASVNIGGLRPVKKVIKQEVYPSPASSSPVKPAEPAVDSSDWNNLNDRLNVQSSPAEVKSVGKMDHNDAIEADGSLNFFWTDYMEINGSLCLFGKVLNKKTKSYVSCFVKVDNILRKLYFLPREGVDVQNVFEEIDETMTKMKVDVFKVKPCTRKYAFEMKDVPKEAKYIKVLYPYTKPQLDPNTAGETYSHVFGSNTNLFEQFVMWKNVMGPCWLKIEDADFGAIKNASHCKLEVLAEHPNMVSVAKESDNLGDAPPLTLMSVSMRTTFNQKENKQEILAISARIYDKVSLADTTPAEKLPCRTFTVMRPHGQVFPMGFDQLAKKRNRGPIVLKKQEADILSYFLAQMDLTDPDVIFGHQLEGVDYSVLLNRLHEKKIHQWSRLGRFRRTQWPHSITKMGGNVFAERQIISGRLLCDLANDMGKSVMNKCQTWSLTEMCSLYLSGDNHRREIDSEAWLNGRGKEKEGLMDWVSHMEADTHYIASLAIGTQILPLTKVLTNLAGNSWARTLTGTRAERNEYILLHEFHKNKYICPDKQNFRGRPAQDENNEEEGGESKKKDKYKGGLVFEPEKGLYDKFVLVMDFNSLYPSIIQEFNICFTTVDRTVVSEDEEAVPEVPPSDQPQGIFPQLIATLVGRRKQVKSLMKNPKATPEELATWDIKQLALKLTANSMYGCLGYTKSRFYARPLAVLTTYKGREILRSTKDLAESRSLQVIYGDTDSVMINANVESVTDAFKVGHEFKKAVNDQYRLLEIDIDNVFRRILLQAKKKYAAINLIQKGDKFIEKMEIKGLDMRRREYCALSKEISQHLLDEILSGEDTEVSVARIHEYLRDISTKMREQQVNTAKYIIYTQLGKAPTDYPNADSMPQVQVALRDIARGKTVRKGDVVSYIITGDKESSEPAPKRAYAPADLKKDTNLLPDVEWYIGKQIFPPVERLCANIVGTSTSQLAEQLGLDIRKYNSFQTQQNSNDDIEIHPLESQIPDEVRFADCQRLSLRCRKCKTSSPFEGLLGSSGRVSASGITCPSCTTLIPTLSIVAQLEHAIRTETTRYYEAWLVCDDTQCGNRTRQMSVYGTRCLGPKGLASGCLGRMRYEYTEKAIYNNLVYFASLFDVDRAKDKAGEQGGAEKDKVLALAEHNRVRFGTCKGVVDKYLEKCGRQWVAMDTLFAKLGFNKMLAAAA